MSAKEEIRIRLPDSQVENLGEVAKLAGVKKETVIAVLLALFVMKHAKEPTP